jgi:hypothetical protein
MDYYKKYIKYKNKYNFIKQKLLQIGGGIEEYDDISMPVLRTIFTDINNIVDYYYYGNIRVGTRLHELLTHLFTDCMLIEVRGNGLCLLNAVCTIKFLVTQCQCYTIFLLLENFAGYHNKKDLSEKIIYQNVLNQGITGYVKSTYTLVEQNFINLSDQIISMNCKQMGMSGSQEDMREMYKMLEFRKNMDAENYSFSQLGQILSTILGCVIISLNFTAFNFSLDGKFPHGEVMSVSMGNISVENISDNIISGVWDIVFILIIDGRHYNALIPRIDKSESIKELNIKMYNLLQDRITWN